MRRLDKELGQLRRDEDDEDGHIDSVAVGMRLYDALEYEAALSIFEVSKMISPQCPVVDYNVANTLHALHREDEAVDMFRPIIESSEAELLARCYECSPRSLRLDAHYMMFLCVLHATGSWRKASPFLRKHLASRSRGLSSVFSKAGVLRDAEELREEFAPRARPVTDKER